ncbi:hypothetical protein CP533_0410 [Ophiocordyceps camponoti-saundersi (nom. inval.)]|nr:hypothetical protein CP533_0410 [Ophiocordyceps camponoti-saundersi (nom. inval.)]
MSRPAVAILSALAILQSVVAEEPSQKLTSVVERYAWCQTGLEDSKLPCDVQSRIDINAIRTSGINFAEPVDQRDRQKLIAYYHLREKTLDDFKKNEACCRECKVANLLLSPEQSIYWGKVTADIDNWLEDMRKYENNETTKSPGSVWEHSYGVQYGQPGDPLLGLRASPVPFETYCPELAKDKMSQSPPTAEADEKKKGDEGPEDGGNNNDDVPKDEGHEKDNEVSTEEHENDKEVQQGADGRGSDEIEGENRVGLDLGDDNIDGSVGLEDGSAGDTDGDNGDSRDDEADDSKDDGEDDAYDHEGGKNESKGQGKDERGEDDHKDGGDKIEDGNWDGRHDLQGGDRHGRHGLENGGWDGHDAREHEGKDGKEAPKDDLRNGESPQDEKKNGQVFENRVHSAKYAAEADEQKSSTGEKAEAAYQDDTIHDAETSEKSQSRELEEEDDEDVQEAKTEGHGSGTLSEVSQGKSSQQSVNPKVSKSIHEPKNGTEKDSQEHPSNKASQGKGDDEASSVKSGPITNTTTAASSVIVVPQIPSCYLAEVRSDANAAQRTTLNSAKFRLNMTSKFAAQFCSPVYYVEKQKAGGKVETQVVFGQAVAVKGEERIAVKPEEEKAVVEDCRCDPQAESVEPRDFSRLASAPEVLQQVQQESVSRRARVQNVGLHSVVDVSIHLLPASAEQGFDTAGFAQQHDRPEKGPFRMRSGEQEEDANFGAEKPAASVGEEEEEYGFCES